MRIKSAVILGFVLVLIMSLCACNFEYSDSQYVLDGYESKSEHYQKGGFQDYTDYCVYRYNPSAVRDFENSEYYTQVSEADIEEIKSYFDNFYGWMEAGDRLDEYDFDDSVISEGDFFNLYDREGEPIGESTYEKYESYNLYFFDSETATLYYIHNNI